MEERTIMQQAEAVRNSAMLVRSAVADGFAKGFAAATLEHAEELIRRLRKALPEAQARGYETHYGD